MAQGDPFEALDDETSALNETLGQASAMTNAFSGQLRQVQNTLTETTRDLANLERGITGGLRKAFDGLVLDGAKLSDALSTVAQAMANTAYRSATRPVIDHVGGLLSDQVNGFMGSLLPFEKGAPFSQGRVMPFAKGGVVSGPVSFPMRGATGLMGEAGPEAIMPLSRGSDGRLGVRAAGSGGNVTVNMNITTPDVQGFQRSRGQIAANLSRALGQGQRNR
jgi:phage-related minor tail protein